MKYEQVENGNAVGEAVAEIKPVVNTEFRNDVVAAVVHAAFVVATLIPLLVDAVDVDRDMTRFGVYFFVYGEDVADFRSFQVIYLGIAAILFIMAVPLYYWITPCVHGRSVRMHTSIRNGFIGVGDALMYIIVSEYVGMQDLYEILGGSLFVFFGHWLMALIGSQQERTFRFFAWLVTAASLVPYGLVLAVIIDNKGVDRPDGSSASKTVMVGILLWVIGSVISATYNLRVVLRNEDVIRAGKKRAGNPAYNATDADAITRASLITSMVAFAAGIIILPIVMKLDAVDDNNYAPLLWVLHGTTHKGWAFPLAPFVVGLAFFSTGVFYMCAYFAYSTNPLPMCCKACKASNESRDAYMGSLIRTGVDVYANIGFTVLGSAAFWAVTATSGVFGLGEVVILSSSVVIGQLLECLPPRSRGTTATISKPWSVVIAFIASVTPWVLVWIKFWSNGSSSINDIDEGAQAFVLGTIAVFLFIAIVNMIFRMMHANGWGGSDGALRFVYVRHLLGIICATVVLIIISYQAIKGMGLSKGATRAFIDLAM